MWIVLTLIWQLNRLKNILMAFKGLWRPLKSWKKGLKNDDMTSFSNSFYDSEFPGTDASKRTAFYGKIFIKESLEIEKTQVVCCGHSQNNYFMLNSNKISHCDRSSRNLQLHRQNLTRAYYCQSSGRKCARKSK